MAALKHLWGALSLLVIGLPALFLFSRDASILSKDVTLERPSSPVAFETPRMSATDWIIAGELQPIRTARATARLRGTVTSLHFRPGDHVSAGVVVAVIRSAELEDRLAHQRASVRKAETDARAREQDLSQAEDLLAQRRELARRDLIPRRDAEDAARAWETAKAAAGLARAQLAQRQALRAQSRALLELTQIAAPLAGEVMDRVTEPGESIIEGGAVLTIGDTSKMKLTAQIPRNAAASLHTGAVVRIVAGGSPGRTMTGQISGLAPVEGDLVQLDVVFDNRERLLRSGMAVAARIKTSKRDESSQMPGAAAIAESAVDEDGEADAGGAAGQGSAVKSMRTARRVPR